MGKLGIKTKPLRAPIWFKQVDGSVIGGHPASEVTKELKLEMGQHWELIHFIVVPKMTESVILGLAWLDKWCPSIIGNLS